MLTNNNSGNQSKNATVTSNQTTLRLEVEGTKDLSTVTAREKLLKSLLDSALESDLCRGVVWSGVQNLPRRWLPHGAYHDLYTLYCAHQLSAGERVASSSTFYRVLSDSGWTQKLKFSPPSSHSKCSACHILKSNIQHAKGIQEHAEACDKLLRHLAGQFADRSCYHQCRNRAKTTGDILCLITDSMDKSKYSLPRYHRGMGYWDYQQNVTKCPWKASKNGKTCTVCPQNVCWQHTERTLYVPPGFRFFDCKS